MGVELKPMVTNRLERESLRRHIIIGAGAGVLLLLVYLGLIGLAQGFEHALSQTGMLWYWVAALAIGFGVQVGLFSFIRQSLRRRAASTATVAASGGLSAVSMAACCAHHLSDLLPLLGASAVATFVVNYQLFFIVLGVLSNAVGIAIMLEHIQRYGLCPLVASWRLDMSWVKRATMISAALTAVVTYFATV